MSNIIKLSASQISLFKRCKRAWYLRYIEKIKEPFKPWLKDGINFHACIEDVYKKILGQEVKEGYYDSEVVDMVRTAFDLGVLYIPDKFIPEQSIKLKLKEDVQMIGYIDLVDVSNGKINDHKSIKSKRWALTEEQMKDDLQLNIYGYWYLNKLPSKKFVWFRHNQLNKIDPELSEFVEVKRSRDEVFHYWEKQVKPFVDEIVEMRREASKSDYTCDLSACGDYGGCGYKPNCEEDKYL
jgi:hypothetical protein